MRPDGVLALHVGVRGPGAHPHRIVHGAGVAFEAGGQVGDDVLGGGRVEARAQAGGHVAAAAGGYGAYRPGAYHCHLSQVGDTQQGLERGEEEECKLPRPAAIWTTTEVRRALGEL